jgi:deoxyribonuclease-2
MYWETWRREPFEGKVCNANGGTHAHNSMNVQSIKVHGFPAFDYTRDHSKWGVSADSSQPWVCVGDMNRMPSQLQRGGTAICFKSSPLWVGFRKAIDAADSC